MTPTQEPTVTFIPRMDLQEPASKRDWDIDALGVTLFALGFILGASSVGMYMLATV